VMSGKSEEKMKFSTCTSFPSMYNIHPSLHSFSSKCSNSTLLTIFKMKTSFAAIVVATMAVSVQGFAPQASRVSSTKLAVVDDKTEVREYFNTEGFNRWNKIYSESDEVNTVQLDIRTGHGQTIQKILNWVDADGDIKGKSVCDCGCGVGSLAIPLAQMGKFTVSKSSYYRRLIQRNSLRLMYKSFTIFNHRSKDQRE